MIKCTLFLLFRSKSHILKKANILSPFGWDQKKLYLGLWRERVGLKWSSEVHFEQSSCAFSYIRILGNYQITLHILLKIYLYPLILDKPSFSQTFPNSSIIKIQTQKHNLKINQTTTIKAKKFLFSQNWYNLNNKSKIKTTTTADQEQKKKKKLEKQ